nr:HNH endonuclease [bacterium]
MVKQSISAGDDSTNVIAGRDINVFLEGNVPIELVDPIIEEEVDKLRKSRFFSEFNRTRSSLSLGKRLAEGNLSGGSDEMRSRGLAWCARILAPSDDLERAENLLELAKTLGDSPETKIAEAFLISQKGDKAAALQVLAGIDSHASHSAGLMVVAHHDGAERALKWIIEAGYTADHLDSDGKSFLLTHQLQMGYWDHAAQTVGVLSESDFARTPILYHLAGLTTLAPAVPVDFRAVVLTQVPFEARGFPLASDFDAMDARRTAHKHFLDAFEVAKRLSCPRAARTDDGYALWLELRDPAQSTHGKNRLKTILRDPDTALGYIHYALQFDIKLDIGVVERSIERSIAINGGMTIDAALARFALAFTQSTPEEAANYIARHQDQLAAHIDTKLMRYRQIEMLSRAGLIEKANKVLDRLLEERIPAEEESNLRRIISEAQGCDPVESRKEQYEATRALGDLINLVTELEDHQQWNDLCKYGRLLFEETRSLNDAERLVNAFNN